MNKEIVIDKAVKDIKHYFKHNHSDELLRMRLDSLFTQGQLFEVRRLREEK